MFDLYWIFFHFISHAFINSNSTITTPCVPSSSLLLALSSFFLFHHSNFWSELTIQLIWRSDYLLFHNRVNPVFLWSPCGLNFHTSTLFSSFFFLWLSFMNLYVSLSLLHYLIRTIKFNMLCVSFLFSYDSQIWI